MQYGVLTDEYLNFENAIYIFAKSDGKASSLLIAKYDVGKNFNYDILLIYSRLVSLL